VLGGEGGRLVALAAVMQEREPDDARADGNHAGGDDAEHDQEHRAQSDDH
jgi:hypothetical protein